MTAIDDLAFGERFIILKSKAIIDCRSDLMWEPAIESDKIELKSCNDIVDTTNIHKLLDYKDWRMPTIHELFNLVDFNLLPPMTLLPNIIRECYWSSEIYKISPNDYSWCVDFNDGTVKLSPSFNKYHIRLVRDVARSEWINIRKELIDLE